MKEKMKKTAAAAAAVLFAAATLALALFYRPQPLSALAQCSGADLVSITLTRGGAHPARRRGCTEVFTFGADDPRVAEYRALLDQPLFTPANETSSLFSPYELIGAGALAQIQYTFRLRSDSPAALTVELYPDGGFARLSDGRVYAVPKEVIALTPAHIAAVLDGIR